MDACIERAIAWGVDLVQIREKDLSDRELYELTRAVVAMARGTKCRVLVNSRADIALAAGAHGIHLPSTGLSPSDLRRWLPSEMIVGVSTHSLQDVRRAEKQGADFVVLGPVYPTASKLAYGRPMGLIRFRRACAATSIPVLGLGGIHADSIPEVLGAGASGIAGISLFQSEIERLQA